MLSSFKSVALEERGFIGLIFSNAFLEGVHRFVLRWQPELTWILTLVQIVLGVAAVYHIVRKAWEAHKRKNEKNNPPSSS